MVPSRSYRLIGAPRKFDSPEAKFEGYMPVLRKLKFQGATIRPIVWDKIKTLYCFYCSPPTFFPRAHSKKRIVKCNKRIKPRPINQNQKYPYIEKCHRILLRKTWKSEICCGSIFYTSFNFKKTHLKFSSSEARHRQSSLVTLFPCREI